MFEKMDSAHSLALDDVMRARHSVRSFGPAPLEKEDVNQILRAGLIAPYAAMAVVGKPDFRKFFVVPAGSAAQEKIKGIVAAKFPVYVEEIEKSAGLTPFVKMLKSGGPGMARSLFDKPCVVFAAERWGIPAIAPESLSYSMENMWLKATALKIGFQLLTIIPGMKLGNDEGICQLFGIRPGDYYLDGFALGYPASDYQQPPIKYPGFESNVKWL